MKRILITILIVLISVNAFAIGGLGVRIELGNSLDYGTTQYYDDIPNHRCVYSDIFLFYDFHWFLNHRIYSGWKCWSVKSDVFFNSPFRQIYTTGYKLQYGKVYFDFKHFCNHAIYSGAKYWHDNIWNEKLTTIAIGIEFK